MEAKPKHVLTTREAADRLGLNPRPAVLENFGYRQINNFWRVEGYWQYLGRNDPNRLFEARLIAVISWDRKPSLKP